MRQKNLLPGLLITVATCPAFAQITPSASVGAKFGNGIASNGFDTVITAPRDGDEGAVFVYSRAFQTWGQDKRIDPPVTSGDAFGASVALAPDGKRLVTGRIPSPTASHRELMSFKKLATGEWDLEETLTHPNPLPGADDGFGMHGVAIAGDLLVVGDILYNDGKGGAFIYRRSATGWAYEGSVGGGLGLRSGDRFGEAVATDGTRVIVGAWLSDRGGSTSSNEGKAFIFERVGTSWVAVATLASPGSSAAGERFGRAVGISGSIAVVGAEGAGPNLSGVAYVFIRNSGTWSLTKTLEPSDGAIDDFFGRSVSIVAGGPSVVLVGAPGEDHSTKTNNGAAYVFTGNGASWTQRKKLHPVRIERDDEFGHAVSINSLSGLLVATVGAPFDDVTYTDQGAAYIYESTDAGLSWSAPLLIVGTDPPEIIGAVGNIEMLEDSVKGRSFMLSDADNAADQLFVDASTPSSLFGDLNAGLNPGGATRTLTLRPKPDQFGSNAEITLDVTDGLAVGSSSFEVTVLPVNDQPSVTLQSSQLNHTETSSKAVSLAGFATFSAGPANEAASQVADRYELRVSDTNGVFQSPPVVTRSGTFNYILSGEPGRATVGVRVRDSGGTANGGIDLSDEAVVVIDNAPTGVPLVLSISISPSSIGESAGVASATISRSGPIDEALSVSLRFDGNPEAVAGPQTVELGAGSRSTDVDVLAVDDDAVNGTRTVSITASADDFAPATVELDVLDDETVSEEIFDNGFEGL